MLTPPLAIAGLGPMEIVLILLVLVLIFGARKLPELGRGIGEGIKNFKSSMSEGARDAQDDRHADGGSPDRPAK